MLELYQMSASQVVKTELSYRQDAKALKTLMNTVFDDVIVSMTAA